MSQRATSNQRLAAYSAALAVGLGLVLKINGAYPFTTQRKIIPSPRTTLLPKLSASQVASLGYPPDALPGSRDVKTPHGYMRVYEWGPVDGRKVVMVHGDATAAPLFKRIADILVKARCRVLCFGRSFLTGVFTLADALIADRDIRVQIFMAADIQIHHLVHRTLLVFTHSKSTTPYHPHQLTGPASQTANPCNSL